MHMTRAMASHFARLALVALVALGLLLTRTAGTIAAADAGPESRALMEKWAALHGVRTGLGFAATLSFLSASLS